MKKKAIILFAIGLLVEILAFSLSHEEQFPKLQPFLHLKYFEAKSGMEILRRNKSLYPGDTGFDVISRMFFDMKKLQNSLKLVDKIFIQKIEYFHAATVSFGNSSTIGKIELKYILSNGKTLRVPLKFVNQKVDELKNKNIFRISIIIFAIGVIIQIIGIRQEEK